MSGRHPTLTSADAELSLNAREVLERRYLARDRQGRLIESPRALFERVARAIARAEIETSSAAHADTVARRFEEMMRRLEFLPNSPTLMNAGRPLGQLAACFVLPVPDSIEGIFETLKDSAVIHQSGGGTGFSFGRLRPHGATVRSTGGKASGPVSFLRVFNTATDAIKQGGTRRGANMGILPVNHPDILEFIDLKRDAREMVNFNLSVGVSDAFMRAVERGAPYDLVDPEDQSPTGTLEARDVFDRLVDAAWSTGDPGIVFLDRINAQNPTPALGPIEATNPCGEQPLLPYEACNLGSINVGRFVNDSEIAWDRLGETVRLAIRFLDDVIEVNRYPLAEIEEIVKLNRKIGLGIMGFADLLIELGIPYDSREALATGERLMEFIATEAVAASHELARERGPFPAFESSIFATGTPRRNATVTTIAPTGTIAMIADCSSGIEPLFAVAYTKRVMDGTELPYVHPAFRRMLRAAGRESPELLDEVARTGGVRHLARIPETIRRLFPTAYDLSPDWHVRVQAAFQRHTENAVSKTVNFPRWATREEVRDVYWLAYREGLKGVTVYRDGSRESQVLMRGVAAEAEAAVAPHEELEFELTPMVRSVERCPECGGPLVHREGCKTCVSCGLALC